MTTPSGSLLLQDFSGGLNNRDTPNELAYNETPYADNWTLDQRGGLRLRPGCTNTGVTLPGVGATEAFIFYSKALDLWLCARETSGAPNTMRLHTRPGDLSGSWTDRGAINSDVATNVAFCDFPGSTPYVVITTDSRTGGTKGTWVYSTGGGLAQPTNANNVSGQDVEVWQNRAWVVGYTGSDAQGNPTRMFFSALGDVNSATAWVPSTNFNDIRDLDGNGLTACAVTGGALIVFKERSAYRVNDSTTGAYSTIDTMAGCVGGRAVCKGQGRLYTWGTDAAYEWSGLGPGVDISGKLQNLLQWQTGGTPSNVSAVFFNQRVYFATIDYNTAGTGTGNCEMVLEYDPRGKWFMRHRINTTVPALARITSFSRKGNQLYAAIKNKNVIYSMFDATAGKDDTIAYDQAQFFTRWLQPNSGMLARLHRLRVMGLIGGSGMTLSVGVAKNWNNTAAQTYDITAALLTGGATYDNNTADIQALGHAVAFQIQFTPTITTARETEIRGLHLIDQSLAWPSPGYPHAPGITAYHRTNPTSSGRGQSPPPLPPPNP